MLTDEGDISNYLGVNIKKNSYGNFELSLSHLVEKIKTMSDLKFPQVLKQERHPLGKHYIIKTDI